ncbi:hypothetical protein FRC02_005959, partial [Tulasnella sp. 418]
MKIVKINSKSSAGLRPSFRKHLLFEGLKESKRGTHYFVRHSIITGRLRAPVWNDDHDPSTSHSRHHDHDISAVKPYEPSSLVQAGTNLLEDDSSSIRTASTSSNISTPTSVDIEVPAPYMQRDRERTPRLPYQQGLFGSSITLEVAPFDTALPALIQSSEIHDGVVFGDLAS